MTLTTMSNDLIDSLPNGPSVDRGVNENENDSSIKAVDDGHFLINDAALAGVHTQFQLPKSIAINQTNVIFTSDGAVYVMVKPPDHGNVMASVNQHLNNMAFQQPPPIDPGLEGTVGDGTVGDATTPSLSMTSPSISLPDKKRREEENSSLLGEARPHDNKRVRYSSPAEALAFQQHAHQSGGSDLALAATISRVYPLATELDDRNLSQYQCLTRRQIEVFSATEDIAGSTAQGRNRPISVGQVGIRCRHCYLIPLKERKTGSSYFPTKVRIVWHRIETFFLGLHCTALYFAPDLLTRQD